MRIAHLIYSEQVAGAENYLATLLPALKEEGIECHLLCVCPEKARPLFAEFCHELNEKGVATTLLTGAVTGFLSVAKQISRYLKQNNIKHLHAHLLKADLLAVMVKKLFDKSLFLLSTKHGYQEKYLTSFAIHKGKIIHDTYYYVSRYLARNINEHIAISAGMSKLYYDLKLIPQPVRYIHHGVNVSYHAEKGDTTKTRFADQQLIIVGRLEEMKGHRYLFDAMVTVIKTFPAVKLLVLGNGTQQRSLTQQAGRLGLENNILFLGFQSNPYDYISASDIIVLPSLFEPFGLVYIEAFALKVPVVAFDAPACNEIISNNETGLLAPLLNSEALAESIIYLLKNPAERKRLADNGYEKYIGYYNTSRMAKETAAWYRSVIGGQ